MKGNRGNIRRGHESLINETYLSDLITTPTTD
ncbi:hypothetical protein CPS_4682 [Colwellia psychrerythraea 34H]|uniref:Uncharacterized protein n=1 Tax=Colwellia psychrerythraea (strain 34H / ATCC BAA-681) TaxID=167879 RepID=Q47V46_COLP3|nr:hypothetical protein CPS_4682 [Colwellia psychrerythraea 34H]